MKRNWKIIRAILCEENTSVWLESDVRLHKVLCVEAGYINAHVDAPIGGRMEIVQFAEPLQTDGGLHVAEVLANKQDLDEVITELDEKHLGYSSEIVFAMMARKAKTRLSIPAP